MSCSTKKIGASLLYLALAGLLVAPGCSSRQPAECCPCGDQATQKKLDEQLMAVLGAARGYHHQADLQLRQGQRDKAIEALRALLALDLDAKWPEAEEVRLDAAARLAKLLLAKEQLTQALELVDAQLAKNPRESFYAANLHAVRGEVLEAQVKAHDDAGEKPRAKEIAREAIAAFERSIAINKRLQPAKKQQKKKSKEGRQ